MTIEIIKQESGRYSLVKKDDHYYACVVCGSSAAYTLNIPITMEQAKEALDDEDLLSELVGEIAFAPNRYITQHVNISN